MNSATRINQYVAAASGLSRRAADAAIAAGQVRLNGRVAKIGETVEQDAKVTLNGDILSPPQAHHYVLMNKPTGYISSRARQGKDPTVYELLPSKYHDLRIAGRLDRDSSGLVLLSDDGPFINRYTHPSFGKTKLYELTLARPLSSTDRNRLEQGIELTDGPSHLHVTLSQDHHITVSLTEGRNRQIRRTLGSLGYTIERLHRIAIGPYQLGGLQAGTWLEVNPQ